MATSLDCQIYCAVSCAAISFFVYNQVRLHFLISNRFLVYFLFYTVGHNFNQSCSCYDKKNLLLGLLPETRNKSLFLFCKHEFWSIMTTPNSYSNQSQQSQHDVLKDQTQSWVHISVQKLQQLRTVHEYFQPLQLTKKPTAPRNYCLKSQFN